jgi:pimeloyl-ACP methyl ester carboxylesterase
MPRPDVIRTPEERYAALPGYAYAPHYREDLPGYSGLRMHYIDVGPADADHTYLCLHGEPTWAYLYRKLIGPLLDAGGRVVAPDLFGFGRSDKPTDERVYTFDFHRGALLAFITALDLRRVTLVVQDWGGILGLTLPMTLPERIDRLLVMNTDLPAGASPGPGFLAWRDYVRQTPDLDVGRLLRRAVPGLTDAEAAAYDAPFPEAQAKAGVRRFPELVPISPEMPGADQTRAARDWLRTQWRGAAFVAVGLQDPVLGRPVMERLRADIRGASPLHEFAAAGHFLQELGAPVAQAALRWFAGEH